MEVVWRMLLKRHQSRTLSNFAVKDHELTTARNIKNMSTPCLCFSPGLKSMPTSGLTPFALQQVASNTQLSLSLEAVVLFVLSSNTIISLVCPKHSYLYTAFIIVVMYCRLSSWTHASFALHHYIIIKSVDITGRNSVMYFMGLWNLCLP